MTSYRIVKEYKKGYYEYYSVQQREFIFFWCTIRNLDTLEKAKQYIHDLKVKTLSEVVHEE